MKDGLKNIAGLKYHLLTVISQAHTGKWGNAYWLVRCDCGTEKTVCGRDLRRGKIMSCGCIRNKLISDARRGKPRPKLPTVAIVETSKVVAPRITRPDWFNEDINPMARR